MCTWRNIIVRPALRCALASDVLVDLASNGERTRVPFSTTTQETHVFAAAKYMPSGFTLRDPHNIPKDDIVAFFSHAKAREERYGAQEAFRFKTFEDKEGTRRPAIYPDPDTDLDMAMARGRKKEPTGRSGKRKALEVDPQSTSVLPTNEGATECGVMTMMSAPTEDNDLIQVDQGMMNRLITQGYPPVLPYSGPAQGEPTYLIPRSTMEEYMSRPMLTPAGGPTVGGSSIAIDPALLSTGGEGTSRPLRTSPRFWR